MGKGQSFRSGFVMFCLVLAVGMAGVNPAWAAATKVVLTGPTTVLKDGLGAYTLTTKNSSDEVENVDENTTFNLTDTSAGIGTFYSDAAGTTETTNVTINNGQSTATVYYRDNTFGTPMLTASVDSGQTLTDANKQIMVKGNNALSFDGTDDYVDCGSNLQLTGSISVEAWVYTDGSVTQRTFVAKNDQTDGYSLGIVNNQPYFWLRKDNAGAEAKSSQLALANQWHHIAGTYDGATIKIFVDGVEKASTAYAGGIDNSSNSLFIGRRNDTMPTPFLGKIDEVRIWSDARTEAEIRANMHRELQGNEAGLVAYYKLDTGADETAFDSGPGGNDGTLTNGPTWQTSGAMSGPGNALDFDISDLDYVEIPSRSYLNTEHFSVEFWMKMTSQTTNGWGGIADHGNYHPDEEDNYNWCFLSVQNEWEILFGIINNVGSGSELDVNVEQNVWHHVAGTYDGSTMSLYLDGVLVDTMETTMRTSDEVIRLGRRVGTTHNLNYFGGEMDEFRVWNTVRTPTQIRNNMCKSLQGDESGLVAYYRMDQQAVAGQTILYDQTPNGNNGTLTNMDPAADWVASTAFNTWIGADSTAWDTAANWGRSAVPGVSDNVGIPYYNTSVGYPTGKAPTISGSPTVNHFALATNAGSTVSSNLNVDGNLFLNSNFGVGTHTVTAAGTTVTTDTLTIGTGTLDCNGPYDATDGSTTFTGAGDLKLASTYNLGAFTKSTGTVTFDGASPQTITGIFNPYNLTIDNAEGVSAAGATLTVDNELQIMDDSTFTSASDYKTVYIWGTLNLSGDITVSGNWLNAGTFNHNNYAVTLDGTNQYIEGDSTFYDLTKTVMSAATLMFRAGDTTTIENALTLQGAADQLLTLRSSSAGIQWSINPQGTRTISYLDVKDSNNTSGTNMGAEDDNSVDSGNNTNWFNYTAPTVTTQAATNVATATATGNGNITNLGFPNPTQHGVCWSTTENPTTSDSKTEEGEASATGAFTSSITGLTPGTTYHYRAYATNTVDTSYGEDQTFSTLEAPTVTTQAATNVTTSGATLKGQVNANGASTIVTFEYGLGTAYGETVTAEPSPVTGSTDTAVSKAITGLNSGTEYHYRVVGQNSGGTTNGEDITFTTSTPTPTYAVTYNANGATSGTAPAAQTKTQGVNLTLATNTGSLARTGYTLTGWNTNAAGSGTHYALGGTYTNEADVTLYAEWTANTYTVTFNASGGTTPVPATKQVTYGEAYGDLAATSREGYSFIGWFTATTGGAQVTSATTVSTAENHTLYAQWTGGKFTLTVSNGTGSGEYDVGAVVSIAANPPAEGKVFDQWTGDVAHVANVNLANTTVTMPDADLSLTATYKDKPAEKFTLTVISGTGSGEYEVGCAVSIAANPAAEGKVFDNWTGQTATVANINLANTSLTMPEADTQITATYKDKPVEKFTLTVSSGTGSGEYEAGAVVSISANPAAEGKVFDIWTGQTANVANVNLANTTVTMPDADISLTATHKDKPAETFTLTVANGTGSGQYEAGAVVSIAADPAAEGMVFDKWTGQTGTVSNINDPNTTLDMPGAAVSVSAAYKEKPAERFSLTVNSGTGSGNYPAGQVVSISAQPAPAGQMFDKWTGQTATVSNINALNTTLTMPASSVVVKAVYKAEPAIEYTLSVQGGTGSGEYKAGRIVTIAATPAASGYIFDKWTGQTANVANVCIPNTTITMPGSNVSVRAIYKLDPGKKYTLEVRTDTWEAMDRNGAVFRSSAVENVPAGKLVTLIAPDPPTSYVFDIWTGQTGNVANVNLPETTLYMPDTNVVVISTYRLEQDPVTLTVASGTGSGTYAPNTVVDIAANDPPADQMFDKWTGQTGNVENINLAETRIVMPSTDVSIQAVYRDKPETLYELSVTSGTGSGEYRAGVMVEITANTAPEGFIFDKWVGQIATLENINSAITRVYMPPNEVSVTAAFTASPQALATGKASSFTVTVSGIEMFNGSAWVPLFAGTAQLDLVAGGTFPGIEDLNLPEGTYTKLRVTFRNAFSTTGTLRYDGTRYYTTAATFGGQTNLASVPTTVQGSMAAYIFRMAAWGALNANVVKAFNITPITVTNETDYQPTLRFTLSNRLRLMGVSGSPGTYYFEHGEPGVSVVE